MHLVALCYKWESAPIVGISLILMQIFVSRAIIMYGLTYAHSVGHRSTKTTLSVQSAVRLEVALFVLLATH